MTKILSYKVVRVHDTTARILRKCTECKRRRLTTQLDLMPRGNSKGPQISEYLCNHCLTITPNWS